MYPAGSLWALLAGFATGAWAQGTDDAGCSCYGLDYTNGGSYLIDGNSDVKFSFTSLFEGQFCY